MQRMTRSRVGWVASGAAAVSLGWWVLQVREPAPSSGERALEVLEQALEVLATGGGHPPLGRREALGLASDAEAALLDRVRAVQTLARIGDDQALQMLERLLAGEAPLPLRAQVASALGDTEHPAAGRLLDRLLRAPELPVRMGAVEGLARRGGPDAVAVLRGLLLDGDESLALRMQVAESLGGMASPLASQTLAVALRVPADPKLVDAILMGLGERPFAETELVFRALLGDEAVSRETRIAALDALASSSAEAAPLLLDHARGSPDAGERRAAVQSLAWLDDAADAPASLRDLIEVELDPSVREALYRGLTLHPEAAYRRGDAERIVARVASEPEPGSRLQGSRLVAAMVRANADPDLAGGFDRFTLPWLVERVRDPAANRSERLLALDALKLAGTPVALDAIRAAAQGRDPVVAPAAERALSFPSPPRPTR